MELAMPSFSLSFRDVARTFLATAALLAPLGLASARAADFTDAQKGEIGAVVKDYLMQNPQVLRDVLVELDKQDKAQEAAKQQTAVRDKSDALFNSPYGEVLGNPNGKVTLVEFFDYNCGYCKRALDDMAKLLKTEPNLRVVLKDFPVLGPGSVEAAQVAGAVRNQLHGDQFWAFHSKLLGTRGPVAKAQALAAAKEAGADMDQLARDMAKPEIKTGIEENLKLADSLSLTGTPSYVLGPDIVVGAVGYGELKGRLDNVVKCGKSTCS
jgi:protein-disulfide isomerase